MKKLSFTIIALILFGNIYSQTSTWNGSASTWATGDGSESNPYLIENAAQLAYLSQQVVIGQEFVGKHFKLMTNINLNNLEWTPIGGRDMQGKEKYMQYFSGIFDGNNKTISNLKITAPDKKYTGLFGFVGASTTFEGFWDPEIRNLSIISGNVEGLHAGGICGYCGEGTIINCSNAATVKGSQASGIVCEVYSTDIINCTNTGNISGSSSYVAGIAADANSGLIQKCTNNGTISSTKSAGGIAGVGSSVKIINCINNGTITADGSIGGIVASTTYYGLTVSCCANTGNLTAAGISSYAEVGGIAGYIDNSNTTINNCYNTGAISADDTGARSGGIIGNAGKCSTTNSYNIGTVSCSTTDRGGVAGRVLNGATVTNCHYLNTALPTNNGYGTSQTSANMKLQSFVTTLNNSQSPAPWRIVTGQNNGYPVFAIQPYVKTLGAIAVKGNSATLCGRVEGLGESIIAQGFRYKKYGTANYTTVNTQGNDFSAVINCDPVSGYLFQTFVTTASGTYYGEELTFTTKAIVNPYVYTFAANVNGISATLNGYVSERDETISSQGFRYKKQGASDYIVAEIPAAGTALSTTVSCDPLSEYLFQAFATTASGTFYGTELSFVTGIATGVEQVSASGIDIYPNPAKQDLYIKSSVPVEKVEAYNSLGACVLIENNVTGSLDVSALPAGIYLFRIYVEGAPVVRKIVVNK